MFINKVVELFDVALGLGSHDGVHLTELSLDVRAERTRGDFRLFKKGVEVESATVLCWVSSSSSSWLYTPIGMRSSHGSFGVRVNQILETLEKLGV